MADRHNRGYHYDSTMDYSTDPRQDYSDELDGQWDSSGMAMQTNFSTYSTGAWQQNYNTLGIPSTYQDYESVQAQDAAAWTADPSQSSVSTSSAPHSQPEMLGDLVSMTHFGPGAGDPAVSGGGSGGSANWYADTQQQRAAPAPGRHGSAATASAGLAGYDYPSSLLPSHSSAGQAYTPRGASMAQWPPQDGGSGHSSGKQLKASGAAAGKPSAKGLESGDDGAYDSEAFIIVQNGLERRGYHPMDVWESHKEIIKRLYLDERRPLKEVVQIMEDTYGFRATPKMYKTKFTSWGFAKNNTEKEAKQILYHKLMRDAQGKRSAFSRHGKQIDLQRYLRRKGVTEMDLVDFEADGTLPPHVRCWTPP